MYKHIKGKSRGRLKDAEGLPDDWETRAEMLRKAGEKVLGMMSGKQNNAKETWWWNEEVQEKIKEKKAAKRNWDMLQDADSREKYKESRKNAGRAVAKSKEKAYKELYDKLETREGENELYRLAKQRDRAGKDIQQVRVMKDADGNVLTCTEKVLE